MKPAEMNMVKQNHAMCPRYEHAIQLLGKRWTGLILDTLLQGPQRFCEMTAAVDGLSDRVLSDRLRELELEGIIERLVYPQIPVRVEYRLTEKGASLGPAIKAIHDWAEQWIDPSAPTPVVCSGMNAGVLENCAEAGADELAQ